MIKSHWKGAATLATILVLVIAAGSTAVALAAGRVTVEPIRAQSPGLCPSSTKAAFSPPDSYPTQHYGTSIASGDFDRDGTPDFAVSDIASQGTVSIFLGNTNGTLRYTGSYSVGSIPSGVAVGDFNGDGKLDLAVANSNSASVSVLLGNGDGTFQPAVGYPVDATPSSIVVADLNGDGKLDIITGSSQTNNVSALLGNGNGTFQSAVDSAATNVQGGNGAQAMAVGDFNGDGQPDLAVALYNNSYFTVAILLGTGDGRFRQPTYVFGGGNGADWVTVADVNGDHKADLLVSNGKSDNLGVLLGNGDGTFQAAATYPVRSNPMGIAVADFNLDGKLDVASANYGSGDISILTGNGDGTFASASTVGVAMGTAPVGIITADMNGDTKPDLVLAGGGSTAAVLLNTTTCSSPSPSPSPPPSPSPSNSPSPTPSQTPSPAPVTGATFHSLPPARVLDTRSRAGVCDPGCAALAGGSPVTVQVTGTTDITTGAPSGVPNDGTVTSVVLNVTVTNPTQPSYLTLWANGTAQPTASNLNFTAGQTVPNLVVVPVSSDGKVAVYNNSGSVDVIFDVEGYYTTSSTGLLFHPLVPARLLDTRASSCVGPCVTVGPGQTLTLPVTGHGGVPSDGSVQAVVVNATVTGPSAPSFLTVYPADQARPTASNLNFVGGQTVPNRVIVQVSSGGSVSLYNNSGSVDVIIDVNAYFASGTGGGYDALTPARILDTRPSSCVGPCTTLAPGGTLVLPVAGQGGVPAISTSPPPTAVVLNVTVTNPSDGSFLTVYPTDAGSRPVASDLNYIAGITAPNLVIVKLSAQDGSVTIYNHSGNVDVIVDVEGWFTWNKAYSMSGSGSGSDPQGNGSSGWNGQNFTVPDTPSHDTQFRFDLSWDCSGKPVGTGISLVDKTTGQQFYIGGNGAPPNDQLKGSMTMGTGGFSTTHTYQMQVSNTSSCSFSTTAWSQ